MRGLQTQEKHFFSWKGLACHSLRKLSTEQNACKEGNIREPTPVLHFLPAGRLFLLGLDGRNDGPLCLLLGPQSPAADNHLGSRRHTDAQSEKRKDEEAGKSNYRGLVSRSCLYVAERLGSAGETAEFIPDWEDQHGQSKQDLFRNALAKDAGEIECWYYKVYWSILICYGHLKKILKKTHRANCIE